MTVPLIHVSLKNLKISRDLGIFKQNYIYKKIKMALGQNKKNTE